MHVFFSGIGGAGIGPLALLAQQAGFEVSGSDKQQSDYIDYLKKQGLDGIHIGQTTRGIEELHQKNPIDWLVYSSAVEKENPSGHPEIVFAEQNGIRHSKRDIFLQELLKQTGKKLIAIAGTHGKTTTTAMTVWALKQLSIPVSYSVGAKLSFGDMGEFSKKSEYFVYEADEYDRNFLSFTPHMAIISGIDYDHPDIYPTREDYNKAFYAFLDKSLYVTGYIADIQKSGMHVKKTSMFIPDETHLPSLNLMGEVNRRDALLVITALHQLLEVPYEKLINILNEFPGVSRRFEKISEGIYTDYAHTPEKIRGAIQMAREVASDNLVVVYEGLHNTRQHFIKDELKGLFDDVKVLYVVPSYRAREDETLEDLTPEKLIGIIQKPESRHANRLDAELKSKITSHVKQGELTLALSAGGGGSLDEWLRNQFGQ